MKQVSFIIIYFIVFVGYSQSDTILPLSGNNRLIEKLLHTDVNNPVEKQSNSTLNKKKASLSLPFFDDFSQQYYYPKEDKWQDNHVYINNHYADYPISYGVATFDGLDYTGYPYDFSNPTAYGIADYLTSLPIDLSAATDSVYLSFFYQPQGLGNKPAAKDSLTLEFYNPIDSSWTYQWSVPGEGNKPFTQVMVPVINPYLTDSFLFRFKNYATLSGNVDHWHVDYIYLDDNRTMNDTAINDVALTRDYYNFLNEYSTMPWSHYMVDTIANMATSIDVDYRNNHSATYAVFYKYEVITDNGTGSSIELYPSTTSSKNVPPYSSLIEPQAVNNLPANDFYFPGDNTADSKVFQIKNYFDLNTLFDDHQQNDTVYSYQVFGNDYGYDDGSAEAGYGVQGAGSKLAQEFTIKKSDTLTALKMHFNPLQDNHSGQTFKLTIWSSLSPESILYQQTTVSNPTYNTTNGTSELNYYPLNSKVYLPAGTYYFGYEKIGTPFLNIGIDLNNDNSSKIHFNGVGVWQNSTYAGSLMLRPVFGAYPEPVIGIEDLINSEDLVDFYPNPASNNLTVNTQSLFEVSIVNVMGKVVYKKLINGMQNIDISQFAGGMYLVHFNNEKSQFSKKLIISK